MKNMFEQYGKCIGKIEFGPSKKEKQVAVVSIINYNGVILIATAAHCIYDTYKKKYNDNVKVSFGIDKFASKYEADRVFLHKSWVEDGKLQYDTAFLLLKNFDSKKYIDYAVTPQFNMGVELDYAIIGFPIRFLSPTKLPVIYYGKGILHKKYPNVIQGISCKAKNGMSGGPWLTVSNNRVVQNSVSSFSFKKDNKILWGPYWGSEIESVLHVASGIHNELPTVVEKKYVEEELI